VAAHVATIGPDAKVSAMSDSDQPCDAIVVNLEHPLNPAERYDHE
jgi:hypothetical protein